MALKEKRLMTEILEKALQSYERSLFSETKNQEISPKKKENFSSIPIQNFPNHKEFKDNSPKTCSFFGKDDKTQQEFLLDCPQPLFDKKKALCRSHNKQV